MFRRIDEKTHRALIIDDEVLYHDLIGGCFELLSIDYVAVCTFDDAAKEIDRASKEGKPFTIVTIDNELQLGSSTYRLAKNVLQRLKLGREYAQLNMGCIMITGTRFSEREVLNLRDKFGLDYFIPKLELDVESLKEGLKIVSSPKKPNFDAEELIKMPSNERRLSMLTETLNIYKNACIIYDRTLARLREKKAKQGEDVSIKLENEIAQCEVDLKEAEEKVRDIEMQIGRLSTE